MKNLGSAEVQVLDDLKLMCYALSSDSWDFKKAYSHFCKEDLGENLSLKAFYKAYLELEEQTAKDLKDKAMQALKDQEQFLFEVPLDIQGPPCPSCNETKTEIQNLERRDILWFVASLFFMVPMTRVSTENWICHSCNHKWDKKNDSGSFWVLFMIIRLVIFITVGFGIYSMYKSYMA